LQHAAEQAEAIKKMGVARQCSMHKPLIKAPRLSTLKFFIEIFIEFNIVCYLNDFEKFFLKKKFRNIKFLVYPSILIISEKSMIYAHNKYETIMHSLISKCTIDETIAPLIKSKDIGWASII
jgi:hypothetical protein